MLLILMAAGECSESAYAAADNDTELVSDSEADISEDMSEMEFESAEDLYNTEISEEQTSADAQEELVLEEEERSDVLESVMIAYSGSIDRVGWTIDKYNGEMVGTVGSGLRLEKLKINVIGPKDMNGGVEYIGHVQSHGWDPTWRHDGQYIGTNGKRIEAIRIRLTGDYKELYDVYYRVHVQTFGWLDWTKNGAEAGTTGYSKRIEAVQITLVQKDGPAPGPVGYSLINNTSGVVYQTHVQTYGWQGVRYNGDAAGTSGQAKRLEAINIRLLNSPYEGDVEYQTHIQTYGWETDWKKNGENSGTSGQAKRLEAIRIRLTGEMAEKCDIWYRVHSQRFGWLGWVCNGAESGTAGFGFRLEAIQIMVLPKNAREFPKEVGYRQNGMPGRTWDIADVKLNPDIINIHRGDSVEVSTALSKNPDKKKVTMTYTWENKITKETGTIGTAASGKMISWQPEYSGDYVITVTAEDTDGLTAKKQRRLEVLHGPIDREEAFFTAHKGYTSKAPGNTIPAYYLAAQAGFDSIEADVCQTADGVFVLCHDNNLGKLTGQNVEISKLTYSQLANYDRYHIRTGANVGRYSAKDLRIPTLDEYLTICEENNIIPQIDLKNLNSGESVQELYQILVERGVADHTILTSFNNLHLQAMRDLVDTMFMTYGIETAVMTDVDWLKESGIGVSVDYKNLLSENIDQYFENGIDVNAYTVNDRKIAGILLEKGVRMFTTEVQLWD